MTENTDPRNNFYQNAYSHSIVLDGKYVEALSIFRECHAKNMLDVGCGTGGFIAHCKNLIPNIQLQGIEYSKEAVAEAEKNGLPVMQLDVGAQKMPFPTNSFDAVFCGEVLEHVFDTDLLLEEIHRVLKPSTDSELHPLVLTTPNLSSWYNRLFLLMGFQPLFTEVSTRGGFGHPMPFWLNAGHIRMFTYRALLQFVTHCGFKIEKIRGFGINSSIGYGQHHPILTGIANTITKPFPSLCSDIMLVLSKRAS